MGTKATKFVPKRGLSTKLDEVEKVDGQFIVTTDDGKIYTDIKVNGKLTRISIGGSGEEGLDFSALSDALTGGTLTNITIDPDVQNQTFDITVAEPSVKIDSNGYWVINGVTTENYSKGDNGITPSIDTTTKHWMIGSDDTNIVAEGQDGITPTIGIDSNGYWVINGVTTEVIAEGQDGTTPTIDRTTKHWMIGSDDTGIIAEGTSTLQIQTTKSVSTCTALASGWTSSIPYSQTVSVSGITSDLNPRIDVIIDDIDVSKGLEEEKQFSYITKATTGSGEITFKCYKTKPTIDLNIIIEVV